MVLDSIYRVPKGGSVKKERKDGLLMHASIFAVFSLFFFYHFLSILFYYSQFFFLSSLWVLPFSSYGYLSPFILLNSMGFLPFVPKVSPAVFGFLWVSLQDYPLTCWLPGHYLSLECACCTTPYSWAKLLVLFLHFPLFVLPEWIRIGGSLSTHPYSMHQVVQAFCLPLLGEMPSQQGIFPQKSLDMNLKIVHFSPYYQTTPSESLDQGPTSLVLAGYKQVVLRPL